jgi:hypothetical protein
VDDLGRRRAGGDAAQPAPPVTPHDDQRRGDRFSLRDQLSPRSSAAHRHLRCDLPPERVGHLRERLVSPALAQRGFGLVGDSGVGRKDAPRAQQGQRPERIDEHRRLARRLDALRRGVHPDQHTRKRLS